MSHVGTGGTKEKLNAVKLSKPAALVKAGFRGSSLVDIGSISWSVTATCCNARGGGISSIAGRCVVPSLTDVR